MNWTWQTFGRELIESQDLDPVYVMLADSNIDEGTLKRFLLAYWCYYHCGVAARIAEDEDFYAAMWSGIENRWPRGMERRYFYKMQAENCIVHLEKTGPPEAIVDNIAAGGTFDEVSRRTQELVGFGPWLGWKAADMSSCVLDCPIDFSDSTLGIYKDPVQGAAFVRFGDWKHPITEEELDEVVREQEAEFADLLAPPIYDRPINIQEVETVLCKAKASHKNAYPMGNDTYHVREGLKGWGDLAQELLRWMPELKPEWLDDNGKLKRDRKVAASVGQ